MSLTLPLVASTAAAAGATAQQGGALVRRSVLPGGVRIISETVPGMRSAAVGAWVPVGSRDESDGHHGSTHFLEHLLFKGTSRRSALDIAAEFDAVGGEANAATGKEHTCYYARVLDDDVPMAVDVIGDMITSALLDRSDFETERGVILEELAMAADDPTDTVHEAFAAAVFGANPLARPIGGTPETIRAVTRDAVWDHYQTHYTPDRLVIAAAGSVDHDRLCELVAEALTRGGWRLAADAVPAPRRPTQLTGETGFPEAATSVRTIRPVEQANVIVGGLGPSGTSEERFALSVLSTLFGGGMSSRLFQEIREKRGLAYSVYSFAAGHVDAGAFGLYAGCAPANVAQVVDLMEREWRRLAADGVTPDELERAQGQLCGGMMLGLEDSFSRMSRLGKAEVVTGELLSMDEMLAKIRAVTAEDVQALAATLLAAPMTRVEVGPQL